jgi:ATP-dependent RNA helicase RhlE
VINYDFPLSAEDYVHRIGRTARQQATGLAISFVTSDDKRYLLDVKKLLGDKLPLTEDVKDMLGRRSCGRHGSGRGEGRHQGSDGGPRAEGMQHGRRGGSRRGGQRPQGETDGASRSQGHVEPQGAPRDEQGEVNGNVGRSEAAQGTGGPETPGTPRRHRRRGGRGRGKSAGQGQPQTHDAA